jgi:hypothetical protein
VISTIPSALRLGGAVTSVNVVVVGVLVVATAVVVVGGTDRVVVVAGVVVVVGAGSSAVVPWAQAARLSARGGTSARTRNLITRSSVRWHSS